MFCRLPCGHMTDFPPPRFIRNSFPAVFERQQWGDVGHTVTTLLTTKQLRAAAATNTGRNHDKKAFETHSTEVHKVKIRVSSQRLIQK